MEQNVNESTLMHQVLWASFL